MNELTCFKAYDIKGGVDIDVSIAYRIGRAVAQRASMQRVLLLEGMHDSHLPNCRCRIKRKVLWTLARMY